MKLTLFDLYPNLSDLHWCADEAALILLYGTDTAGQDHQLIFSLADELNTLAVRGDVEYRPYPEEDAKQLAERGEFPPLRLKATSVLEWALWHPSIVEVCDETKSWYSTKRPRRFVDCLTDDQKIDYLSRMLNPEVFSLAKQKFMADGISTHQRVKIAKRHASGAKARFQEDAIKKWQSGKYPSKRVFARRYNLWLLAEHQITITEAQICDDWLKGY